MLLEQFGIRNYKVNSNGIQKKSPAAESIVLGPLTGSDPGLIARAITGMHIRGI